MATLFCNAEAATAGTNVLPGQSIGGDPLTAYGKSASAATIQVSTASGKMAHGTRSIRVVPSMDATTAYIGWQDLSPSNTMAFSTYFNLDSLPTATTPFMQIRSASGPAASVYLTSAGKVQLIDVANATTTLSPVLQAGTTYRLSMFLDYAAPAFKVSLFQGDSTTPLASFTQTGAYGSAQLTAARVGKLTTAGTGINFHLDDLRVTYPATDLNAPETASPPPSVSAGTSKTAPVGVGVQLSGSGSGTGALAYSWALSGSDGGAAATLTNADTATPTVTPTAGGILRYTLTVTDTATGATAADTVTVYAPTATVRPLGVTANNGWTTTGAADGAAALADNSPATYTTSPDNPATPAAQRIRLAPLLGGSGFTLTLDHQLTASGPGTATVTLYEGSTARKVWTLTSGTAVQTATLSLSASELAAITSLNALDVELSWVV